MEATSLQPDKLALIMKGLVLDSDPEKQEMCLRVVTNLAAEENSRASLEELGVTPAIMRLLLAPSTSDVMLMMGCWILSNLSADGPTPAIQQELESGALLEALKRIFVEEKDNADVIEKMLWLLTNLTTDNERNKRLVGAEEWGFLELLASLLDFSSELIQDDTVEVSVSEMEYPEKIVIWASKVLLNLFFDDGVQQRFIQLSQSVQQVVTLLASTSHDIQRSMVDLLVMLSAFNTDTRSLLVRLQAPARLARILNDPEISSEILESAVRTISNLAIEEENNDPLLDSGTVLALVDLVTRPSFPARLKDEVVGALQVMAPNQEVREIVLKANAVPSIVDLILSHLKEEADVDTVEDALRLLVVLTLEESYRTELLQTYEADVAFRVVLHASYLEELHDVARMGLENLNASSDGPLQRRPPPMPVKVIERIPTLRKPSEPPTSTEFLPVEEVAPPPPNQDDERFYMKRKHIAKEILETEKSYVNYLGVIVYRWLAPLEDMWQKNPRGAFFTLDDLKKIFSVIKEIREVNAALLQDVESALAFLNDNLKLELGNAFLAAVERFKIYSAYVNNYDTSIETLDKVERHQQWKVFKQEVMANGGAVKDLSSLLIMPIQRIPRYLLLLTDLKKNTPRTHPDHPLLELGLPKMQELANWMESEKDKFEVLNQMSKLSKQIQGYPNAFMEPGRKLLKDGLVLEYVTATKRSRYRYLFVFTDTVMITEQKKSKKADRVYKFIEEAPLLGAQVTALPDTLSLKNAIKLKAGSKGTEWTFFFGSRQDADVWFTCVNKALAEVQQNVRNSSKIRLPITVSLSSPALSPLPNSFPARPLTDTLSASTNTVVRRGSFPDRAPTNSLRSTETNGTPMHYSADDVKPVDEIEELRRKVFPQTPEEVARYKEMMIARYEDQQKANAALLERKRSMRNLGEKERRGSEKKEKKEDKRKTKCK